MTFRPGLLLITVPKVSCVVAVLYFVHKLLARIDSLLLDAVELVLHHNREASIVPARNKLI